MFNMGRMENTKEVHTPFQIKDGLCYSIIKDYDTVVGIFISNGLVNDYPNGDRRQMIGYKVHACLFNTENIMNPIILAGPEINGVRGVEYPRDLGIRFSTDEEQSFLLNAMKKKFFIWDAENKCVTKISKKKNGSNRKAK